MIPDTRNDFDTSISPLDYFNKTDALEITWYHGTNSQTELEKALNGDYNMLEGDIQFRFAGTPIQVISSASVLLK